MARVISGSHFHSIFIYRKWRKRNSGSIRQEQVIGELVLYHYPKSRARVSNTLNPGMTNLGFALYLGKLVYDMGPELGTQLWQKIFHLASDAFENVVRAESSTPLESRRFEADTPFLVVHSNEVDPLKETAKIRKAISSFARPLPLR